MVVICDFVEIFGVPGIFNTREVESVEFSIFVGATDSGCSFDIGRRREVLRTRSVATKMGTTSLRHVEG